MTPGDLTPKEPTPGEPAPAIARGRDAWRLLQLSAIAFIVSAAFGLLAASATAWPGYFPFFDFTRVRPLHTFFALAGTFAGSTGLLAAIFGGLGMAGRRLDLRWPLLSAFTALGATSLGLGYGSGREYVSWLPALTPLLLLPVLLNAGRILAGYRALTARSPEGFWLIATGAVFVCIGLTESHLWLLPAVGGDSVKDLTVQWQGLDLIFSGNNMLLYGCALLLMRPTAQPLRGRWLFAIAATSLLFSFGHHHYASPQPRWLKDLAVLASMLATISFIRHVRAYRAGGTSAPERHEAVPAILGSVERWTLVTFGTGILFAVPYLNTFVHGTHAIVAHAMGGMIGVDFMLVIAGGLAVAGRGGALDSRRIRLGVRLVDVSLAAFWVVLAGAGISKGLLRFSHDFSQYQPLVHAWLTALPFVGLGLAAGIGLLCAELLRACHVRLESLGQGDEATPGHDPAAS